MAFELSRVDRLTKTYDLAARFPDLDGPFTAAEVALLPPRSGPNGATLWDAAGVTAGVASVMFAGPDADSSGAVVVTGSADLWLRVTVGSEVDAVKVERITLLGSGTVIAPGPLPQVLTVQGRTGAVVLDADDVGAVAVGAGAGGALSGSYPNPGLNASSVESIVVGSDAVNASFVRPLAKSGTGPAAPLPMVNVRDMGAVGNGVADDTAAITAAITALAGRGTLYAPAGTYLIASTIALTTPISIIGDGAGTADSPSTALTTIKFTGTTGAMLSYTQVYGIKIEGVRFDGNAKATLGITADRLRNSVIERSVIANCTTVGLRVTTNGTTLNENSMFNSIRDMHITGSPIGIDLDGDTANLCNACHNKIDRVVIAYTGAYALRFGNADNNTIVDLMTTRTSGTGVGIGFIGDVNAADGQLARGNYLYHVQGTVFARAGSKDNMIFGYDQENGQTDPVVETGAILSWLGNAGAVQQRYWSIAQYISAPNISQRNGFINGGFDIWTYGTSFTDPVPNTRLAPRWLFWNNSAVTGSITRQAFDKGQTDVPGAPRYFAKFSFTGGAATAISITNFIEGADTYSDGRVEKDGQRYVRVAFWAKWSGAGALTLATTLKQNFGTGGSPSATVSTAAGNAPLTGTWQQFSFFVALPSVAGKTFGSNGDDTLAYELTMSNAVGDLSIAQFKIEPGIRHSRYIRRDIAEEEHLCSRYVQSVTAQIGTTDTVLAFRPMAKNPTVTGGGTGFTINALGPAHLRALQTAAGMQTLLLRAE